MSGKNITSFKKKQLWSEQKLKLECLKLKYFYCEIITNCKIYIKDYKYNIYKILKNYGFTSC